MPLSKSVTELRLQEETNGGDERNCEGDDQTENHSYMSEVEEASIGESEIMAARKRLNFDADSALMRRLTNPVAVYSNGQARRKGKRLRKHAVYPFTGDSCSSSDQLTQSLLRVACTSLYQDQD